MSYGLAGVGPDGVKYSQAGPRSNSATGEDRQVEREFDRIEDLDENEQVREVFARFGRAIYLSQVFEHGIANLAAFVGAISSGSNHNSTFDELLDAFFALRQKEMVKRAGALGGLSEPQIGVLQEARLTRNQFGHSYFREHDLDFQTQRGRQRMVDRSDAACDLFTRADAIATAALFQIGQDRGLTSQAVESKAAEILREALERGEVD